MGDMQWKREKRRWFRKWRRRRWSDPDPQQWQREGMALCTLSHFSGVQFFVIPWTVARQAPLAMVILQTRILEQIATPSSWGSSQLRGRIGVSFVSWTAGRFFPTSSFTYCFMFASEDLACQHFLLAFPGLESLGDLVNLSCQIFFLFAKIGIESLSCLFCLMMKLCGSYDIIHRKALFKLQTDHLMPRARALENTLILGKIKNKRRREKQRSLVCSSPWGHKELDTTLQLNNNKKDALPFKGMFSRTRGSFVLPVNRQGTCVIRGYYRIHLFPT